MKKRKLITTLTAMTIAITLAGNTAVVYAAEPTTTQTTDAETPAGMYRSELTNEWISASLQSQRPIAVMVDNEKIALPHYGLTEADVVYELMNSTKNGRITRLMAVVKDWGNITRFGSIRSTRPTNIMLAAEWNAVLCHDGGPYYINSWLAKAYSNNFNAGFSRIANGKAREFTEYIVSGDLQKKFAASGYSTTYNEYYPGTHFQFSNTELDLSVYSSAIAANEVQLPFPHNSSTLKYNAATGTYDYYEYGSAHKDPLHNNAQLTFKNVLIQDCTWSQLDSNGYLIYNCIDNTGRTGYYMTDGKAIPVIWYKLGENTPTVYYNALTGEQIQLNTGKTYIALVPSDVYSSLVIK
jgi:hypothetical protein